MNRQEILKTLASRRSEIELRFGVSSLAVFGSVARGEEGAKSDVDILVTYERAPGIFGFLELREYLEGILRCKVDLATKNALRKQMRDQVLQEAIYA